MEIEELLFCKICHEKYSQSLYKPFSLACGHTLCETCLKKIETLDKTITCPFCKERFSSERQKININYILFEMVANNKLHIMSRCETHKKEVLKFFCKSCKILICQDCLLTGHLGPDHEIQASENFALVDPIKSHLEKIKSDFTSNLATLKSGVEMIENDFKACLEKLKEMKNKMHSMLDLEYENVKDNVSEKFKVSLNKYQKMVTEYQEKSSLCEKYSDLISKKEGKHLIIDEEIKEMTEWMNRNETVNLIKPLSSPMEVDDLVILKGEHVNRIIEEQNPFYDPKMIEFLDDLKDEDILKSEQVYRTMIKINRKNFISPDNPSAAYIDRPLPIIKNTTISAPHMHARTLEELKDYLRPNIVAVDIGSGSGYMAAAMAELAGKNSKVYAVDHIQELIEFSKSNIKKKNSYLIDENRIEFVTCDGRKGLPDKAPFDVIHVGGALISIPNELINQLKNGGVMWIPVGPSGSQAIYLVEKDMSGTVHKRKLIDVSYGLLTTVQEQLNI